MGPGGLPCMATLTLGQSRSHHCLRRGGCRTSTGRGGEPDQLLMDTSHIFPVQLPFTTSPLHVDELHIPETHNLAMDTSGPEAAPGLLPVSHFEVSEPSEVWEGQEGGGSAPFEFTLGFLATF